jgi:uncharacterized membrane protein HdeD (DUF308 family)
VHFDFTCGSLESLQASFVSEATKAFATNLNSMKRPFQVTMLGWLFIAVGILSTIYHLLNGPLDRWTVPMLLVGTIAIVAGIFLLRGARWARWLVLAWLAFHVVVSALNSLSDAMPHVVLLVVVGYFLLGPPTSEYFRSTQSK